MEQVVRKVADAAVNLGRNEKTRALALEALKKIKAIITTDPKTFR